MESRIGLMLRVESASPSALPLPGSCSQSLSCTLEKSTCVCDFFFKLAASAYPACEPLNSQSRPYLRVAHSASGWRLQDRGVTSFCPPPRMFSVPGCVSVLVMPVAIFEWEASSYLSRAHGSGMWLPGQQHPHQQGAYQKRGTQTC